jgi:hypothetical protein
MGIFNKEKAMNKVIGMANPFSKGEKSNKYSLTYSYDGTSKEVQSLWVLGCRSDQNVVSIKVEKDETKSKGKKVNVLTGKVQYSGEGEIHCSLTQTSSKGNNYVFVDGWGALGDSEWTIGDRDGQDILEVNLSSDSNNSEQNVLKGSVKYAEEGLIELECREVVK